MPSQDFDFATADGRKLSGQIDLPVGSPRGYAIFAHCFTCSKRSLAAVRIGRALAAEGIGLLRFDFTGIGESEGEFGHSALSSDVADLLAAASALRDQGMPPSLLIGHSLGGAAVLAAASRIESVRAVATINAPFDVEHVKGLFSHKVDEVAQLGEAQVTLGGRSFRMRHTFLDDLAAHDEAQAIRQLRRPLLILHAPLDEVVGIDNATAIFTAARHPKSFVALDGADHLLSDRAHADFAARIIAAWAGGYMTSPQPASRSETDAPVASLTGAGKFQTRVQLRDGSILSDEPKEVGGLESGPTPYELVGAGLAACTAMTMNLYAGRKGWQVPAFQVEVAHSVRPGEDPVDRFTRRITFLEPIGSDQRERLLEIADRCPVHQSLERGAAISTIADDRSIPTDPAAQHFDDMGAACDALDERD